MKIVLQTARGGIFDLSARAIAMLNHVGVPIAVIGRLHQSRAGRDVELRAHPDLVAVVEKLGFAASGTCSHLQVVEIPDDVKWDIEEIEGVEHVTEVHRTWWAK